MYQAQDLAVTTVIRNPIIHSSPPAKRVTIAPNTVELKRLISTFTYRIEAKPEGGFVAHASDSSLPPLEAPTRAELQQKIQDNIGAAMAREFPGLNLQSGNAASGNRELKFDFHIEAKPGGGFTLHSSDPNAAPIEGASHEDIAHPLAEKLAGMVGNYLLPNELTEALARQGGSGDVKVFVNRKAGFAANSGSQNLTLDNAARFPAIRHDSARRQPGRYFEPGRQLANHTREEQELAHHPFLSNLPGDRGADVLLQSPLKRQMCGPPVRHNINPLSGLRICCLYCTYNIDSTKCSTVEHYAVSTGVSRKFQRDELCILLPELVSGIGDAALDPGYVSGLELNAGRAFALEVAAQIQIAHGDQQMRSRVMMLGTTPPGLS